MRPSAQVRAHCPVGTIERSSPRSMHVTFKEPVAACRVTRAQSSEPYTDWTARPVLSVSCRMFQASDQNFNSAIAFKFKVPKRTRWVQIISCPVQRAQHVTTYCVVSSAQCWEPGSERADVQIWILTALQRQCARAIVMRGNKEYICVCTLRPRQKLTGIGLENNIIIHYLQSLISLT